MKLLKARSGAILATLALGISSYAADMGGKPGLSDGKIAEVVQTANEGEIDAAKLAQKRAQSPQVKAFAKKMEQKHKQNHSNAKTLLERRNINAIDSDMAENLEENTKEKISELRDKEGEDFDRAYIQSQVDMHSKLLRDLETQLIPAADDPKLKNHLEKTKEAVQGHLEEAKRIQASL